MIKNKYLTIVASDTYADNFGDKYPDIHTFPIEDLKINYAPQKYTLTINDIYRFDILIFNYYGDASYDDLVLWYNNIEHIADVSPGTEISLPDKRDIDSYYREYLQ